MPVPSNNPAGVSALLDAVAASCGAAGLTADGRRTIDYGEQLTVGDGAARISVNVYAGKKGLRTVVGGAPGSGLRATVSTIVARVSIADSAAPTLQPSRAPRSEAANSVATAFGPGPWIGSDESGKGDYFGPLVAAAVYVGADEEDSLRRAGVRDSKLLDDTSSRRVAAEVRRVCDGRFAEFVLEPRAYNTLYREYREGGKNLNHLLAAGHVRVLTEVLLATAERDASQLTVIADQFADERRVRTRLKQTLSERGSAMPRLVQEPRAEANVAVAAASILARDRFIAWLDEASAAHGIRLPKGGSNPAIVSAARTIVAREGEAGLESVAKLHFATSRRVLPVPR